MKTRGESEEHSSTIPAYSRAARIYRISDSDAGKSFRTQDKAEYRIAADGSIRRDAKGLSKKQRNRLKTEAWKAKP